MNEKVLKTLEYNKIIELLVSKSISNMGKELSSELLPTTDLDEIIKNQKETTEATHIILKKGSLPLGGIKDIRRSLKRVAISGVLSIEELLHIGDFLYVCKKTSNYIKNENRNENKTEEFELVENYFDRIETISSLEKEINRCIANENEINDEATKELYDIRRSIKSSNSKIKEQLNNIIHSASYKNMIQDAVITIRNDRFCVPIKQEYRNSFPGMVHDQSSTGATCFIEPMSVVTLNNKIKELVAKEKTEIDKILRMLSEMVNEYSEQLQNNTEILTYLDFVFAKGELSISMNATEPVFNTKGYINIIKARHPILTGTVIPIDIYIGGDFNTLLITGPNTGGKTVALKTLGLFTLMGQSGLHIAAFDHSELAVFDEVFADIGDEQSIEQSLSTFSSHMTNIVKILSEVNYNSLVLLDELGAGTDPTEGAALGISILEHLHKMQIRVAVTTHYSELKVYALSTDGVENASCEFDVETLRPTYKLLIGIPGKSNAFAISRRLGLDDTIINDAKEFISHENIRFEDVITDLEISKKSVALEQRRAEEYRQEAEKLKKEFELQKQKLNNQRDKILLDAKEEARRLMQQTKEEADLLIRELQKQARENALPKEMDETRNKIKNKLSGLEDDLSNISKPKKDIRQIDKKLKKGDTVFVHTLNQSGVVEKDEEANGDVMVQVGIMKTKIHKSNLSLEKVKFVQKSTARFSTAVKKNKSLTIMNELDLRGNTIEEGLEKTDKYLDDAYLSGLLQVTIIHGKGTGALRSAISNHLRNHPVVKSYRLGVFGEGETGVTVVELK